MRRILNSAADGTPVDSSAFRPESEGPSSTEGRAEVCLADVPLDQPVVLVRCELPVEQLEQLYERGVLPGARLCPVRRSPGGHPIVLVDGSQLALRRDMAERIFVRVEP